MVNQDKALWYLMGELDDEDVKAFEAAMALDPVLKQRVADEARLEIGLRDLAAVATFCPGCDDLMSEDRCSACGAVSTAGGYRIEEVLVQNAHGRLYAAKDEDGRKVALKELAFVQVPSADVLRSFERETRFLRSLEHPAIPKFVASFQEGEGVHTRLYLAQEFIEGESLERRLRHHRFTEQEVKHIAFAVLDIVAYLQSLSPAIVHRDIKPANLIQRKEGGIALVDFGAAHDQGETLASTTVGTFGYMPPEQMAGESNMSTDIYALGASMLYLLTRQEPWKIFNIQDISSANISDGFREALLAMTKRDISKRPANAEAAKELLAHSDSVKNKKMAKRRSLSKKRSWKNKVGWLALAGGGAFTGALAVENHFEQKRLQDEAEEEILRVRGEMNALGYLVNHDQIKKGVADPKRDPLALGYHAYTEVLGGDEIPQWLVDFPDPIAPSILVGNQTFKNDERVSFNFEDEPLSVAIEKVIAGHSNWVIPDELDVRVNQKIKKLPRYLALNALLSLYAFNYRYDPKSNLIRITKDARLRQEQTLAKIATVLPRLPEGTRVDLNLKQARLNVVLKILSDIGQVNFALPHEFHNKIFDINVKDVPWNRVLEGVLASLGLWYEYQGLEVGTIRIASPKSLFKSLERVREYSLIGDRVFKMTKGETVSMWVGSGFDSFGTIDKGMVDLELHGDTLFITAKALGESIITIKYDKGTESAVRLIVRDP